MQCHDYTLFCLVLFLAHSCNLKKEDISSRFSIDLADPALHCQTNQLPLQNTFASGSQSTKDQSQVANLTTWDKRPTPPQKPTPPPTPTPTPGNPQPPYPPIPVPFGRTAGLNPCEESSFSGHALEIIYCQLANNLTNVSIGCKIEACPIHSFHLTYLNGHAVCNAMTTLSSVLSCFSPTPAT